MDLLLLDIFMPKMSGVEIARQVAKSKPKLKIIMITALLHHGVAMELYKCGVVDFLIKPLDKNKTLQAITQAITPPPITRSL